jgi:hypothetical protein
MSFLANPRAVSVEQEGLGVLQGSLLLLDLFTASTKKGQGLIMKG